MRLQKLHVAAGAASSLDDARADEIKHRAQDSRSEGVLRQDALREAADEEGYIEPFLWSGIGRGERVRRSTGLDARLASSLT